MIALVLVLVRPKVIREMSFYLKPKRALNVLVSSFNDTMANLMGFVAYQVGRNALQLAPLSTVGTIVTVIFARIFLKERDNFWRKLLGSLLVVIGTILLV